MGRRASGPLEDVGEIGLVQRAFAVRRSLRQTAVHRSGFVSSAHCSWQPQRKGPVCFLNAPLLAPVANLKLALEHKCVNLLCSCSTVCAVDIANTQSRRTTLLPPCTAQRVLAEMQPPSALPSPPSPSPFPLPPSPSLRGGGYYTPDGARVCLALTQRPRAVRWNFKLCPSGMDRDSRG
jgi:hypothetical protein